MNRLARNSGAALDDAVAETTNPISASYGPQKGNAMFPRRIRDRLKALEDRIAPNRAYSCSSELRARTFRPMPNSAGFKAEHGVTPQDTLIRVVFA